MSFPEPLPQSESPLRSDCSGAVLAAFWAAI